MNILYSDFLDALAVEPLESYELERLTQRR